MHSSSLRPVTIREASKFVSDFHRHHKAPRGARFAIAAMVGDSLVGVAIVGRPAARALNDGRTAEVIRLCTIDIAPKGTPARLLRAAWRAWAAIGGRAIITYTLVSESGASLRGAGFSLVGEVRAKRWDTPSRRRSPRPIEKQTKLRWKIAA